jgi:hypothetical protein
MQARRGQRPRMSGGFPRLATDGEDDMLKDELKQRVYPAIEQRGDEIIGLGEQIRYHPELEGRRPSDGTGGGGRVFLSPR